MGVDANIQFIVDGQAIGENNPMPIEDVNIGAVDDTAVVDPAEDATAIALLKGILSKVLSLGDDVAAIKADVATVEADIALVKADVATLKTVTGAIDDVAVTDPLLDTTVIAALKGIVTNTAPAG